MDAMNSHEFQIAGANGQGGRGTLQLDDTRFKSKSVAEVQALLDGGTIVFGNEDDPAASIRGNLYEVTARPLQGDKARTPIGSYVVSEVGPSLPLIKRPLSVTLSPSPPASASNDDRTREMLVRRLRRASIKDTEQRDRFSDIIRRWNDPDEKQSVTPEELRKLLKDVGA
jgi:hypothetical protein